jgi:ribosome production factor 1
MPKRKERDGGSDDDRAPPRPEAGGAPGSASIGAQTAHIGNKIVRSARYAKLRHDAAKAKKSARKARDREAERAERAGLPAPPQAEPKTIENQRVRDETEVGAAGDAEVDEDEAGDEFAAHFARDAAPNVLITTCFKPSAVMYRLVAELLEVLPAATYYKRQGFALKKIAGFAVERGFTDLVVVNEDRRAVNGLLLAHLPHGPTAQFRLSSLVLGKDIKGHGRASAHKPELVLNHFDTRLGRRLGRMLAALFPQDPAFRGRRVVTFHNQRDYVFFRHHRYVFEEKGAGSSAASASSSAPKKEGGAEKEKAKAGGGGGVKARLQELGPRFTLRLQSLQRGVFDPSGGEFEWVKKKETASKRRAFQI